MTFDGSREDSRAPVALRAPAQVAIREFLHVHRTLPPRGIRSRLFGESPISASGAHWFWAAVGELEVVAGLHRLGPEWCVLHGLPGPAPAPADEAESSTAAGLSSGASTVDHLIIGPAGVFSVAIHDHTRQNVWVSRRAFVVDGHRVQHIRQAEAVVGHVERMLEAAAGRGVRASTIIAVIDPGSLDVRSLPKDVFVVAAASITTWLKTRECELDPAMVAELAGYARLESTWPDVPVAAAVEVSEQERAEFEQVRRDVTIARIIRAVWAIGATVALTGTLVAIGILQLVTNAPL
ncbi:hypothetical protein [Homoserinimonas sp. A520]